MKGDEELLLDAREIELLFAQQNYFPSFEINFERACECTTHGSLHELTSLKSAQNDRVTEIFHNQFFFTDIFRSNFHSIY